MNKKWNDILKSTEKQLKSKVIDDIKRYFEDVDTCPSIKNYLAERSAFLQQVYQNVWKNIASKTLTNEEKLMFLQEEAGIIVDPSDKKTIKRLFKDKFQPPNSFSPEEFLLEIFDQENQWQKLYEKTKQEYKKWIEKQNSKLNRENAKTIAESKIEELFTNHSEVIYVYIRYEIGRHFIFDLKSRTKYKLIGKNRENERVVPFGKFNQSNYIYLKDFFSEYTGDILQFEDWGRIYYDYETFDDLYKLEITSTMKKVLSELFLPELKEISLQYGKFLGENIGINDFLNRLDNLLNTYSNQFYQMLKEEYVNDLVNFSSEPFNLENHLKLYREQLIKIQEKKRIEEEERLRKIEEENRILQFVFEWEFNMIPKKQIQYILHIGETNTGKTYQALKSLMNADSGCYLAPLRLLAIEVFDKLNTDGVPCSLKTGEEEKIIEEAAHMSSTVEMFNEKDYYDCIVIDEAQMIADPERGFSWYKAITMANAKEVHIIGSKSCKEILLKILENCQVYVIEYSRDIPLQVEKKPFSMKDVRKGDALICFSRRKVLETAAYLEQKGKRASIIYGSMPPETRKAQILKFINKKNSIIVATDAIGMGLNLPIRRIVFLENEKFDGVSRRRLSSQEVKQIAGRAGRKGIYDVGYVAFMNEGEKMSQLLKEDDPPIQTFTISPTSSMFERFQQFSRDLGYFFELWKKFKNPKGTIKSTLAQEIELYQLIRGTSIEARFSIDDLYGFLHLPFSSNEPSLTEQWLQAMTAISNGEELPEPVIKIGSLDEVEFTYKSIGLYLLFLYRLGQYTEAQYWERIRLKITEEAEVHLKRTMKKMRKKCRRCGKTLPIDFPYPICDACHARNQKQYNFID